MASREPIVYVAHALSAPTREAMAANRARASRWVAWVARNGCSPIASWITLSEHWDETPANRRRGLAIDCRLVERCDAVLWVGGRVSDGMLTEGEHAKAQGIPVLDLTDLGEEPPQFDFPLEQRVRTAIAQVILEARRG